MSGEQFAETAVLIAQMDDDEDKVYDLLGDFSSSELSTFATQLYELLQTVQFIESKKRGESR